MRKRKLFFLMVKIKIRIMCTVVLQFGDEENYTVFIISLANSTVFPYFLTGEVHCFDCPLVSGV